MVQTLSQSRIGYPKQALKTRKREVSTTGLSDMSSDCLDRYFDDLAGMTPPPNLHDKVMSQVEKPLIEHVLRYVRGNQVRAASVLGINRNTLRKKISALGIDIAVVSNKY